MEGHENDADGPSHTAALSFSGSGVLSTFQAGVAHFVATRIGPLPADVQLLGTSGGAIVAVLLACGYDFSKWVGVADAQIAEVRASKLGLLCFGGINLSHMQRILPPNAHVTCSGRVGISTTRLGWAPRRWLHRRYPWSWRTALPWRNARLRAFRSRDELLGAVALSSHAPGLYGLAGNSALPRFRGGDVGLDGGLTENVPLFRWPRCAGTGASAARTLTVSPVDATADVHGAPELRWFHILQLAGVERLRFLFELGWRRAEAQEAVIRQKLLGGRGACERCANAAPPRSRM